MSEGIILQKFREATDSIPEVDGMGYTTDHIKAGAGISISRHSHKAMPNGRCVNLFEHFPSPVNPAGKHVVRYAVWLGRTDEREDGECPFPIPPGAKKDPWVPDAEGDWYADFGDDMIAAESYAGGLAQHIEQASVASDGAVKDLNQVHEAGNDTTAWFSKVLRHHDGFEVVVYDADGDRRPEHEVTVPYQSDAVAIANQVVLPFQGGLKSNPPSSNVVLSDIGQKSTARSKFKP